MNDDITVMTLNVYVGANVDRVLAVQDPVELPRLVAEMFPELLAANFPERAEAIADAIAHVRPQLIGLQEISTIRLRCPGEAADRDTPSADTVRLDYLDLLLAALTSRGLDYRVAGCIQNIDITLPLLGGDTIQLVDSDVVLARGDVHVAHVVTTNYQHALTLPALGITIPRGYVALDATWATHHTYRFVSTHLEPDDLTVQLAQAEELVATLASATQPVVVVGDLNTPAPTGLTYQFLVSQGYVDVWTRTRQPGAGAGYTFPHAPDLRNEAITLTQRLDYIFVRPEVNAVCATIWGDVLADRTPSGLWPSDHAAVIAALRMRP
jgi:endonuclease/exonuclease/phosphatase family metal-dependent hydrolase